MNLFDYIFYRIYNLYKSKGSDIPISSASSLVSLIEFFMLLALFITFDSVFNIENPNKLFLLPVIGGLLGLNWYRYEKNKDVTKFEKKWAKENLKVKRKRGWLIILISILLFLTPILLGILKHNLNVF